MVGTQEIASYTDLIDHPELDSTSLKLIRRILSSPDDEHKRLIENLQSVIHNLETKVFEISEPKVKVTEHQIPVKQCLHCKTVNRAMFPPDIKARVQYGTRIKRRITYLFANHFIPYERVTDYFADVYGHKISEGTVNNALRQQYYSLGGWDEDTKRNITGSEVVHFDESGMRESGKTKWVHVASTKEFTYYSIHESRGSKAIDDIGILPEFKGIAVHDGYKPYFKYRKCNHVLCNAHHIRELRCIYESFGIEDKLSKKIDNIFFSYEMIESYFEYFSTKLINRILKALTEAWDKQWVY